MSTREPLVDEGEVVGGEHSVLGVLDQPVVLGMEDVMDRGEADILVHAAVAGDEVGVEQLVVVLGVAVAGIGQADRDVAVGDLADRHRLMGDVGEEGVAGADGAAVVGLIGAAEVARDDDVVGRVGNAVGADAGDELRQSRSRSGMKLP